MAHIGLGEERKGSQFKTQRITESNIHIAKSIENGRGYSSQASAEVM